MPLTPDADLVMLRPAVTFMVALEPAQNGINSLLLLNSIERRSGLGEWVTRTAASLSPELLQRNQLVALRRDIGDLLQVLLGVVLALGIAGQAVVE